MLCAHGKRTHAANQILFAESKHVDQTESGPVSSAIKSVSCESKQIEGRRSHSTKESESLFPSYLFLAGQKESKEEEGGVDDLFLIFVCFRRITRKALGPHRDTAPATLVDGIIDEEMAVCIIRFGKLDSFQSEFG